MQEYQQKGIPSPGEPMRKPLLCLLTVVLVASSAKGVSSSPDCQRWLADYKKALAQKQTTQHLLAVRNRARAAARRKLAHLTRPAAPAHPPTRISSVRPHLSPAQMLKRFDLLCGDLPVEDQVLDSRMSPDEFISEVAMGGPVVNPETPGQAFPQVPTFGPVFGGVPVGPGSPSGPGRPAKPGTPPTGGTPGSPTGPDSPIVPGSPTGPPVAPPIAAVPEPGSVLLVLTGVLGAGLFSLKRSLC